MKAVQGFLILCLVLSCCCSLSAASHPIYSDFASPEGGYHLSSRAFSFAAEGEQRSMTVAASDFAVYRYAYVSFDGRNWERFPLTGTLLGGDWLNGSVSGQISFSPSNFSLSQSRLSTQRNYVVLYSCSRTGSTWDCHGGWQIWQFDASLSEPAAVQITGVTSSYDDGPLTPGNTLDGNLSAGSRWSAEGDGQWIAYELSEEATVGYVRFAFYYSTQRYFDIQYSVDGTTWTDTNATGMVSAPDMEGIFQRFDLEPVSAVYIRFVGHGSSAPNLWNGIIEADINGFGVNLSIGCTPRSFTQCFGGDVYWYDSCGGIEDIFEDCVSGEVCADGECTEEAPEPYCGDGTCDPLIYENCSSCEADCGECVPEEMVTFSTGFEESNWEALIRSYFGTFSFQYSCPQGTDNYYEIAQDPEDSGNSVLHFVINNGCDYSGRVQGTLVMDQREEYHFSNRYYISEDLGLIPEQTTYMWLALGEYWEQRDDSWDGNSAGQAVWQLSIVKNPGVNPFYWRLGGSYQQPASVQGNYMWVEYNNRELPLGEWFELEWYIKRGQYDGHMQINMTPDGGREEVLFDVYDTTVYPDHMRPITWFEPWKIYLNVETVNYIKSHGGDVDIFFDDFRWYDN